MATKSDIELASTTHPPQIRTLDLDSGPQSSLGTLFRRSAKRDPDAIATQPSVFDDPQQAPHFHPHPQYENLHRFDPDFRWTWAEELPLIRRLDWKITAWAFVAFLALNLDQASLSQANTDNFLADLKLNTNGLVYLFTFSSCANTRWADYNTGVTLWRVGFLIAEIPSQLISKKIGPDTWIPTLMVSWALVAICQFWLSGRPAFLACRFLIGLLQGGFIPDLLLYMSYFWKGTELPFRMALLFTSTRFSSILAPLLAYGVLRLRGYRGQEGWRWLFLVEGLLNLAVGIWSFFMMAASPSQTKRPWRPNGWFTEREEKIMVNRILRDDPSKGDMHNRQPLTPRMIWEALCDYDLWPMYLIGLTFAIPSSPPNQYLTLTLRQLGFTTFQTNLLTIPAQFCTALNMLLITWVSEKIHQRAYLGIFTQLWYLPCLIALAVLPSDNNRWATYGLLTVLLSYPVVHPLQTAWCSRNSNTVRTRAVSAALYNIAVQLQSIIGANIYREDDRPLYRRGNRVLIGINCMNIVLYLLIKLYYTWRNKKRDEVWNSMTPTEKLTYLNTTTEKGSKRLDFRFAS